MGNGQALLITAAACWLALLANLLGGFLRRFKSIQKLGVALQWLAFVAYLLGLAATVVLLDSVIRVEQWASIAWLIAAVMGVPLVACSIMFCRVGRRPAALSDQVGN